MQNKIKLIAIMMLITICSIMSCSDDYPQGIKGTEWQYIGGIIPIFDPPNIAFLTDATGILTRVESPSRNFTYSHSGANVTIRIEDAAEFLNGKMNKNGDIISFNDGYSIYQRVK